MKKVLFLSTLIAAVLLASSCQKEQELVTLGAVISQPGKTYIDDRYPCWNNGDQVYVNNAVYPISAASGSSAQIADVVGADNYRAIFPASLVPANMDISNSSSIPVTLPATQVYTLVDGHQRVNAPMGAYTDGEVLQFHNLCSIVHVVVNNNTGSDMALDKLRIATDNAYLSGTGTATVTGTDNDGITLSSDASHSVSLRIAGPTSVTLAAGAQSSFDIYVPAFPTDNVTITLYTTNGYYFELTKNSVALTPNTYTSVTLNVTSLTQILAAELVDGPTFNAAIPDNATAVVFEYNSSVSSGTLLSTSSSPVPIYGNLDGTTWRISTRASIINANPDCQGMFAGSLNYYTSQWVSFIERIDFGEGFNTTNVTYMHRMFYECNSLRSLDLSNFNTENVTTMYSMFDWCSSLISLDISNFNTKNVTGMSAMFLRCSNLTSFDVSNFNTENVTNMSGMFSGCSSLTSLDVSNFNTENVTNMSGMFSGCSSLTSLDVYHFNTEKVTDMGTMFIYCNSLTNLDVSNFVTGNVTSMNGMFCGCSSLTSLDLSDFNTENVTDMNNLFRECKNLTTINLDHFDMSSVISKYYMCYLLSTTSRYCTITCPTVVRTELENDTYLPGSVTFTWVTPASK
ncbi:MAG: BspA family leucine-rich repeat surface protein [Bacteroidales bacterium]|nr:BspA family leucine-rich repeat surface protein [Bacteroidales bacterium]